MAKRIGSKKNELIVREVAAGVLNLVALAPNATEVQDNVNNFFNDTPYNLDLVAVRIGTILGYKPTTTDISQQITAFGVVELSRQAIAGQQEGIVCNQRSVISCMQGLAANGGKASYTSKQGEMLFGDFKTPLMTLEVQNTLFLHGVITNMASSATTIAIGEANHAFGVTLYFRVRSTGY